MKTTSIRLLVSVGILFMGAHSAGSARAAEPINVGFLLPLTGKLQERGQEARMACMMALDQINRTGGVGGRKVRIIVADTEGIPEKGRIAVKRLVGQDKVLVLGGAVSSDVAMAAGAAAHESGVPLVVSTAAADAITEQGWDQVFRIAIPSSEHLRSLESLLSRVLGSKTSAVIYEQSPLGEYGMKRFSRLRRRLGIALLVRASFGLETTDFGSNLAGLKRQDPQLLYIICGTGLQASRIVLQASELGFGTVVVGNASAMSSTEFREGAAGPSSAGALCAPLWSPSLPYPGARQFYEDFLTAFSTEPDHHGAQAHSTVTVIADALKRAASFTPEEIRKALLETDMMTVFGPVSFGSYEKKRRQNSFLPPVVQWTGSSLEIVWPSELASAPLIRHGNR